MVSSFSAAQYKKLLSASDSITHCPKVPLPNIGDDQNYIFISYSHRDYKEVYADLADMHEAGVRFWYDKGLPAGKDWESEVRSIIENPRCVGVIFYLSENLFMSESASKEIEITYRCTTCPDNPETSRKNYFSVNLRNKAPLEILLEVMQRCCTNIRGMAHIRILSSAFPDNVTYISYHAPNHFEDLLAQIDLQFGVLNDADSKDPLGISHTPCDVFIGSMERIDHPDRVALLDAVEAFLADIGYSSYRMQDTHFSSTNKQLHSTLQEYCARQNAQKLTSSKCVIFLSSLLFFLLEYRFVEQYYRDNLPDKAVFYLIDGGSDWDYLLSHLPSQTDYPQIQELLDRVAFDDDYQSKLQTILEKKKAE